MASMGGQSPPTALQRHHMATCRPASMASPPRGGRATVPLHHATHLSTVQQQQQQQQQPSTSAAILFPSRSPCSSAFISPASGSATVATSSVPMNLPRPAASAIIAPTHSHGRATSPPLHFRVTLSSRSNPAAVEDSSAYFRWPTEAEAAVSAASRVAAMVSGSAATVANHTAPEVDFGDCTWPSYQRNDLEDRFRAIVEEQILDLAQTLDKAFEERLRATEVRLEQLERDVSASSQAVRSELSTALEEAKQELRSSSECLVKATELRRQEESEKLQSHMAHEFNKAQDMMQQFLGYLDDVRPVLGVVSKVLQSKPKDQQHQHQQRHQQQHQHHHHHHHQQQQHQQHEEGQLQHSSSDQASASLDLTDIPDCSTMTAVSASLSSGSEGRPAMREGSSSSLDSQQLPRNEARTGSPRFAAQQEKKEEQEQEKKEEQEQTPEQQTLAAESDSKDRICASEVDYQEQQHFLHSMSLGKPVLPAHLGRSTSPCQQQQQQLPTRQLQQWQSVPMALPVGHAPVTHPHPHQQLQSSALEAEANWRL